MLKLDANAYRGEGLSIRRWQTHGDTRGKGAWRRRQQWKTTSPLSPREPQLVSGGLPGSTAPTLRTAITPQPQNKCCFNRSCSSDPVISPPIKGKLPHFSANYLPWLHLPCTQVSSKQAAAAQQPSPATPLHPPGLRSGGSRLWGAAFIALVTTQRGCASCGDSTKARHLELTPLWPTSRGQCNTVAPVGNQASHKISHPAWTRQHAHVWFSPPRSHQASGLQYHLPNLMLLSALFISYGTNSKW